MTTSLEKTIPSSALAPALVSEIVALHGEIIQSARTTLDKAIRIGQLLTEQKATLKHGLWLRWIEDNLPFAERTARNYMTVYCRRGEIGNGCRFELTDAYKLLSEGGDKEKSAHVSNNSGENEWYTPPQYIEAALAVMGSIDLDPASCETANKTVGAAEIFTKDDDGLSKTWGGNVWMNPPYAQPLIGQFAEKITAEVESGNVKQACVLVNNATETAWFRRMMERASAVCFPTGRVRFLDQDGKPGAPLQGQAVLYFGTSSERFTNEFSQLGIVTDTSSNAEPARRVQVLEAASANGPVTAASIRQVAASITVGNSDDVVMTPRDVALDVVHHFRPSGLILDPCRGSGAFADAMPGSDWCELAEGRDFYNWRKPVDWIISNPPYSIFADFLRHSFTVAEHIVYLIPVNKVFNSDRIMREIWTWGGVPEIYVVGGGAALDFPIGFCIGAVHFQRNYAGPINVTFRAGRATP